MASKHTTLGIVNYSGMNIVNTTVSGVDSFDWDGSARPDHNFKGAQIGYNDSRCEREEINTKAKSSWYEMTFTFADGSTLHFRNNQRDAETKHNRVYSATGSATGLVLYQTSGGNTNAMTLRAPADLDNSGWMGDLLRKKPELAMNQLTMPGSHDAAMYTTNGCGTVVKSEWTRTQGCSILDQLKAGSRYFDLRPYSDGKAIRLGHFGDMGGCYGPKLDDVLDQIRTFLNGNSARQEVVTLKFSHTMSDSPIPAFITVPGSAIAIPNPAYQSPEQVAKATVTLVKEKLAGLLYTSSDANANLSKIRLQQVAGKVICCFDDEFKPQWDTRQGIFPFHDIPKDGDAAGKDNGVRIYDHYSETASVGKMIDGQLSRLSQFGGWDNEYLFLLSWTLTGETGLLDVEVLAAMANPWLPQTLAQMSANTVRRANIIYLDYIDPYMCRAIIATNYDPATPINTVLTARNKSGSKIKVAVNHWGSGGNTDYFDLQPNGFTTWDRSDRRGFVLALQKGDKRHSFVVQYNSDVAIFDNYVTIDGKSQNY